MTEKKNIDYYRLTKITDNYEIEVKKNLFKPVFTTDGVISTKSERKPLKNTI